LGILERLRIQHQLAFCKSQLSANMPPPRGKKRKSEQQSTAPNNDHLNALQPAAQIVPSAQYVATKTEDDFTDSPSKRRKVNITVEQKQGLINNLQIERKLSPFVPMDNDLRTDIA
jgi:hypothetical protein